MVAAVCMGIGTVLFETIPRPLLSIFSNDAEILSIGTVALRIIGASFVPISLSLIIPTYFQAIGKRIQSVALVVLRQIFLLIPLAWGLSFAGLTYVWLAFPITEIISALVGYILYLKCKV